MNNYLHVTSCNVCRSTYLRIRRALPDPWCLGINTRYDFLPCSPIALQTAMIELHLLSLVRNCNARSSPYPTARPNHAVTDSCVKHETIYLVLRMYWLVYTQKELGDVDRLSWLYSFISPGGCTLYEMSYCLRMTSMTDHYK